MLKGLSCLLVAVWLLYQPADANAAVLRYCDRQPPPTAAQQDILLRFASVIKNELENSGQSLALIARSGLDLTRFGMRYSHAGISLKLSANAPWSVRQLYYECEEDRPKIFDQGISGFLLGTSDPSIGYISLLFLPQDRSGPLEQAALDNRQALRLLGSIYSANAYPFAQRYQNCNQWVMEMIAATWGRLLEHDTDTGNGNDTGKGNGNGTGTGIGATSAGTSLRVHAQAWLQSHAYAPAVFDVGNRLLMWLGSMIPWVHSDDHPSPDLEQAIYRVSMPASIELFVRAQVPDASRVELCHTDRFVVIRRGWQPIAAGCEPAPQDTVIRFD